MKRIHFDSKGPVKWHYFFWQPWGCGGCLARAAGFMLLLALFLFLLSQFRSCRDHNEDAAAYDPTAPVSVVVPPINEDDVIDDGGRPVVGNRLNVLFGAETGQADYEAWVTRFKELYPDSVYQVLFYDPNTKLMSIQVEAERRQEIMAALPQQIPDIPFLVFEEEVMEGGARPNDPVFGHEDHAYYFNMIKAQQAWDLTMGSQDVIVAIVDSYFDLQNVEFADTRIVAPYSVARGDSIVDLPAEYNPQNPDGVLAHGTMVAAMAVGATNNGRASAGMAPSCRLMPISLSKTFGSLAMLQGVLYAINHRAQVINISAGVAFTDEINSLPPEAQIELARTELLGQQVVWDYVYDMAARNFVTIVWAAGNEDVFCAMDASKRNANTIRVSAVDATMSKAEFSNYGNFPEQNLYESTVSAPGVSVPGLVPKTTGYMLVDGTSFSAPIVTGCVGLVKSLDPTLATTEIVDLLQSTGVQPRGAEASTIGPIVQIGPALEKLYTTFMSFDDFRQAISSGSGSLKCACITYLNGQDPTALPPIYEIEIIPTGPNTGKIKYFDNREQQSVSEGTYTAEVSDGNVVLTQQATTPVSGEIRFSPGTFTVSANERGKAVVSVESESWDATSPFLVKSNS